LRTKTRLDTGNGRAQGADMNIDDDEGGNQFSGKLSGVKGDKSY